jgi:hypothetical protein
VPVDELLEEPYVPKAAAPQAIKRSLRALSQEERSSLALAGLAVEAGVWVGDVDQADLEALKAFTAEHGADESQVYTALLEEYPALREWATRQEQRAQQEAMRMRAELAALTDDETQGRTA